ncbi:MAG: hypothetical protein QOG38_569, partial [Hyphomicrobiales bacterium]|nr:hypothetical protein [Hyphomicrobiales bacterium]
AVARGLVERKSQHGRGAVVVVTERGRKFLDARRS